MSQISKVNFNKVRTVLKKKKLPKNKTLGEDKVGYLFFLTRVRQSSLFRTCFSVEG